jgi:ADP-ribose pyrophosphatase YjhB (NUDIX family)
MTYRFCPHCATELRVQELDSRRRPRCPSCGFVRYQNPTTGVAVVVVQHGKLLLVQRRGTYDGRWCIPCGHVEWDEDVRTCARREMKEETGLDVRLGPVVDVLSNFHDPEQHTVGIWFAGAVLGGRLRPGSDARDARFYGLNALPADMAFPTDLVVCDRLRALVGTPPARPVGLSNTDQALQRWFRAAAVVA